MYDIILPAAPVVAESGVATFTWLLAIVVLALCALWLLLRGTRSSALRKLRRAWREQRYDNREALYLLGDCLRRRFALRTLDDVPRFVVHSSQARWRALVDRIDTLRYRKQSLSADELEPLFGEAHRLIVQSQRIR